MDPCSFEGPLPYSPDTNRTGKDLNEKLVSCGKELEIPLDRDNVRARVHELVQALARRRALEALAAVECNALRVLTNAHQ